MDKIIDYKYSISTYYIIQNKVKLIDKEVFHEWSFVLYTLKPLQNKKGQKNSFSKEKDCVFVVYLKFFWPFLFWNGFTKTSIICQRAYDN